ncbi:hypothetical protein N7481_013349 [Penicillium waksmanii]|uniref:uncharacterized protein n=1 Tax=Penicillium waksmanii TaxID=69791 RepID=UPI00254718A8|nr:uncharacterized protein N7481_013349 [Penicillium waksmanii]KAJ5966635.1 hypothetical protein N7481_013349 [Penicillium waksmanii]
MTTNPKWPEIQSQLLAGQNCTDVPALVFMREKFGDLLYKICVTEFQKRGLPHAYLVVKLQHELPLTQLGGSICAELPDPEEDPALHAAICRFHMHSQNHFCGRAAIEDPTELALISWPVKPSHHWLDASSIRSAIFISMKNYSEILFQDFNVRDAATKSKHQQRIVSTFINMNFFLPAQTNFAASFNLFSTMTIAHYGDGYSTLNIVWIN